MLAAERALRAQEKASSQHALSAAQAEVAHLREEVRQAKSRLPQEKQIKWSEAKVSDCFLCTKDTAHC